MSNRGICAIIITGLMFGVAVEVTGQGNRRGFGLNKRARERLVKEAEKQLEDSKVREAAEEALRKAEEFAKTEEAKQLKKVAEEAAGKVELTEEEQADAAAAEKMIKETVGSVSEEASKIINKKDAFADLDKLPAKPSPALAKAAASAALSAPAKTAAARKPGSAPEGALPGDEFPDPVVIVGPQPLLPPPRPITPAKEDYTRIDANGGAYLHSSEKIIVFKDDVSVDHKIFDLSCDQLEVFLYKDVKIGSGSLGGDDGGDESDAAAGAKANRRTDIMKAIATGYVVITKSSTSGTPQVGKCRYAIYEDTTGDLTMRGMPQVQRGSDLIIATDETTRIVFRRDGNMEVHGPHRTEIVKSASVPGKRGQ